MNIEEFLEKKRELAKLLQDNAKEMLKTLFEQLFTAVPELKTVVWTQYTPYFNDGDPCVFSVHEPSFATEFPEDIDDFNPWGGDDPCWIGTYSKPDPRLDDFNKMFGAADDVLETLGDHSKVIVTKRDDGIRIEVEEYDHD